MAYIKSHSNYVLKKKSQDIKNGTIYERDITTIGGLNHLPNTQTPIYSDSNFIITVGNGGKVQNKVAVEQWATNNDSEIWTKKNVSGGLSTTANTDSASSIVLKKDFYKINDFAYFGSCSELVKNSIDNILTTFLGEIYIKPYSIQGESKDGVVIYYNECNSGNDKILGKDNTNITSILENPYDINLHTAAIQENEDKMKFLLVNDTYKKYQVIDNNGVEFDILSISYTNENQDAAIGECVGVTTITCPYATMSISGYVGNNQTIYYMTQGFQGYHIRPKKEYFNKYKNSLSLFEQCLINDNTTPKYKTTFEVTTYDGNEFIQTLEDFIFPTSDGDYNLSFEGAAFEDYYQSLLNIADFYDEHFTDNIYRSMTHESIKNLDWSIDDEDKIEGGNKFAKVLRLFGYEFDNIKGYIDNLNNTNTISYNEVNNLPDYFLTDNAEIKGWDCNNVYPFTLDEYYYDKEEKRRKKVTGYYHRPGQRINVIKGSRIERVFSYNPSDYVQPYSINKAKKNPYGYFICCMDEELPIDNEHITVAEWVRDNNGDFVKVYKSYGLKGHKSKIIEASANTGNYYDDGDDVLSKIKTYTNEGKYTYSQINNLFFKELVLNSKEIIRHKGTIDGIENLLGLFGMRSRKWVDNLTPNQKEILSGITYDFDIVEKTAFTNGIFDPYNQKYGKTIINWYNSTKTIPYNTDAYAIGEYEDYQGLPVKSKTVEGGNIIYPYFDKTKPIDGSPYYQMKGGWMRMTPYQFDNDNNIIYDNEDAINGELYNETQSNIITVDRFVDLFSIPTSKLSDYSIVHVNDLSDDYIIIGGNAIYPIRKDTLYIDGEYKEYEYFSIVAEYGYLSLLGEEFNGKVVVSNPLYESGEINVLDEAIAEQEIKVYFIDGDFNITLSNEVIDNDSDVLYLRNGQLDYVEEGKGTPYFVIVNKDSSEYINEFGWTQVTTEREDPYFARINRIKNKVKGNNPHVGNNVYDGGFEYISYFSQLFKNAFNNDYFDESYYDDYDSSIGIIGEIGFKALLDNNGCKPKYKSYPDKKIHAFCNIIDNGTEVNENINVNISNDISLTSEFLRDENDIIGNLSSSQDLIYKKYGQDYHLTDINRYENEKYGVDIDVTLNDVIDTVQGNEIDDETSQIINTKLMEITFYIHDEENNLYSKYSQEEVKYISDVILPYLEQMIPSDVICTINFKER